MILPSREYSNADEFAEELGSTLMPEVEQQLLAVRAIDFEIERYQPYLNQLSIAPFHNLYDLLNSVENPVAVLNTAYRLLGKPDLAAQHHDNSLYRETLFRLLEAKDETTLKTQSRQVQDLGLEYILKRGHLEDVLYGILITRHYSQRYNSIQRAFREKIASIIGHQLSHQPVEWHPGPIVIAENQLVDGAIFANGKAIVAIQTGFFSTNDSQVPQMLRHCGRLQLNLSKAGIVLVWVIDGKGVPRMKRMLKRIYTRLPNIYTTAQLSETFGDEVVVIYGSKRLS